MYPISGVNNTFAAHQFNPNFYRFYSFSSMKNVPHSNQTNNLQQMSYPKKYYTLPHINIKKQKERKKIKKQKIQKKIYIEKNSQLKKMKNLN